MSLVNTAQHLAAHGRGPDTMLVHMSPDEVQGLQALAKARGRSLTVNPHTGLPEAFSLGKISDVVDEFAPVIAGAGLTAMGVPAPISAAIVGGVSAVRSKSLQSGLLAGIGAYGGANIAGSFAPTAAATQAAPTAIEQATTQQAAEAAKSDAAKQVAAKQAATKVFQPASVLSTITPTVQVPLATAEDLAAREAAKSAVSGAGVSDFLAANRGKIAAGYMGLQALAAKQQQQEEPPERKPIKQYRYRYDPGFTGTPAPTLSATGERLWFQPTYTELPSYTAARGGLVAMAEGGKAQTDTLPNPMTGASRDVYEYLMGQRATSRPDTPQTAPAVAPVKDAYTFELAPGIYGSPTTVINTPAADAAPSVTQYTTQYDPATSRYLAGEMTLSAQDLDAIRLDDIARLFGNTPARPDLPSTTSAFTKGPIKLIDPHSAEYADIMRRGYMATPEKPYEKGGHVMLEHGGFVVPADVVSALGNGSSSAGLEMLARRVGAKPIQGPGDGMSDSIPTTIGGRQRAAIARDEAYVPAAQVAKLGGARKLYAMMDNIRSQAHGKTTQQRKVNPRLVPGK